ncbi:MAG: hypothetical protein PHT96_04665 [Syntrophorhabdaceae bacterium]|nr:hypothetical protein [Syntrophorhabdaceae bacterium]MDD4195692.1 hypothetical protein [Syntrophorhabdaceae bacterium]
MKKHIVAISIVWFLFFAVAPVFSVTPHPPKSQKIERFTGRVTSVNMEDSVLVVQSMKADMTFDLKGARLKGYKTISDIKEGDRVTVQYVMHEGKATVRTLTKNRPYR